MIHFIHDEWFLDSAVRVWYRPTASKRPHAVILESVDYSQLGESILVSGNTVDRRGRYPKSDKSRFTVETTVIHQDLITKMEFMVFNQYTLRLEPMSSYHNLPAYRVAE